MLPRAYQLEHIQIGKLVPLAFATIDRANNLNLFCFFVYPEVDQVVFDWKLVDALTAPGFFFRQRDAIGELIQRSDFLLERIQHFHGSFRCLECEADITYDLSDLLLGLLRDFYGIFLWHLLHLPF